MAGGVRGDFSPVGSCYPVGLQLLFCRDPLGFRSKRTSQRWQSGETGIRHLGDVFVSCASMKVTAMGESGSRVPFLGITLVPTSDPLLQPVSSPTVFVRQLSQFYTSSTRISSPAYTTVLQPRHGARHVAYSRTKLVDEHFRSMERRDQRDGIWLGVLGKIAIHIFKLQASSPTVWRVMCAFVCF